MSEGPLLVRLNLPPLPPTIAFPPLPPITDRELEEQVFMHSSYHGKPRRATSISLDEGGDCERLTDNEKLEHVGDSLIGAIVTLMLDERYPTMRHGPATMLKAQLVRDSLLAQLSRHYDFPSRLIADPHARWNLIRGEKTTANLFEAYVAGLFYSYRRSPLPPSPPLTPRMRSPTGDMNEETLDDDYPPRRRVHTYGEAIDHLTIWLKPLFLSLAEWVLEEMQQERERSHISNGGEDGFAGNTQEEEDKLAIGAIARMNEHFIVREGQKPEFQVVSSTGGMWMMRCVAMTKEGIHLTAEAARENKNAAKTVAAWKICKEMGLK